MKCQLKPVVMKCWRNLPDAPVPIWVARQCHDLGGHTGKKPGIKHVRKRIGFPEVVIAHEGEYLVMHEDEITVFTPEEFETVFDLIEEKSNEGA